MVRDRVCIDGRCLNIPPRDWRGLTMTSAGLRLLQDLHHSLLGPPRQLRPRIATATSQPGGALGNAGTIA